MTTAAKIQEVKFFLSMYTFSYGLHGQTHDSVSPDKAVTIISKVADAELGIGSEIAKTVLKYKRMTEKQAYCIARAAVENNKTHCIEYLFEDEDAE